MLQARIFLAPVGTYVARDTFGRFIRESEHVLSLVSWLKSHGYQLAAPWIVLN